MKTADIKPDTFYCVRLAGQDKERVRVTKPQAEPRYEGDVFTVEAERALLKGILTIRLRPHSVLYEEQPSERTLKLWKMIEEESEES